MKKQSEANLGTQKGPGEPGMSVTTQDGWYRFFHLHFRLPGRTVSLEPEKCNEIWCVFICRIK